MGPSPYEPLVSIVVPTRDRADMLSQTLESVRHQTYLAWECLVIDDGSRDDTCRVVRQISKSDPRVQYHLRPSGRGGAGACRNQGLALARGEKVIFLDSDDLLAPDCIASRVAVMEAEPSLDFAVFGIEMFRRTPGDLGLAFNAPSARDDLSRFLELDAVWQTMAPIWRRGALVRLGGWAEDLLSFQDWELHVRALATGLRYRKFEQLDCWCRIPGGHESVSMHVYSREHLRSHVRLLEKVRRVLRVNGRLREAQRRRLGGLYLWLAQKLQSAGDRDEAASLWRRCLDHRLVDRIEWMEGQLYLAGQEVPFVRRAARMYLLLRWPREMARKGSRTVQNTPLRPGVALRPPRRIPACLYEFPA
jgi:GT2 family glycosyltransferase